MVRSKHTSPGKVRARGNGESKVDRKARVAGYAGIRHHPKPKHVSFTLTTPKGRNLIFPHVSLDK